MSEIEIEVFKFTKFPQLLIELQLIIWRAALSTLEVALYPFPRYANDRHVKIPPILLQVNQESREEP